MLGFAALAEVALAEVPAEIIAPVAPALPFRPRGGKIFIIDSSAEILLGASPKINEPCALIINVEGLLSPIAMFFTSPSGIEHLGSPQFTFVGGIEVQQFYILNFPSRGYAVYQFDIGELSEAGLWTVKLLSQVFTGTFSFLVVD